jgi:hypothetical protein
MQKVFNFKVKQTIKKVYPNVKALYVDQGVIYVAKGYKIYTYNRESGNIAFDGKLIDSKYTLLSAISRMLNRLLRIEPSTMLLLKNGSRLVSAKKALFVAEKNSQQYIKVFDIPRGNKPLNIALNPNDGHLYFGEYILNGRFSDTQRSEVHIYKSEDSGLNWYPCYTFPKNTIRHIHGVFYDKFTQKMWVTTGDRDSESIIANSDDGFKTLNVFKQGKQRYRAVTLLFYEDYIVYGTDTEHEKNHIYAIHRETGEERCLQALEGSTLMATQNTLGQAALSTAVEPSEVNQEPYAHVWFSDDGFKWQDIYHVKKDAWSARYFQYGRITFPQNALQKNQIVFSGHALQKIDNKMLILNVE